MSTFLCVSSSWGVCFVASIYSDYFLFRAGGKQSAKGWGNRKGQQGFKAQFPAAWSLVQCTDIYGNHRLGAKTPDRTCRTNHQQFRLFKPCLGKPNKFQQLKIIYTLNLLFWPKKKQGWIFVIHSHPSSIRSIIPLQGSPIESLSRATPQKERIIDSNHPFSGAEMLVSGSVLYGFKLKQKKWPIWSFASTGDPNRIQLWIVKQHLPKLQSAFHPIEMRRLETFIFVPPFSWLVYEFSMVFRLSLPLGGNTSLCIRNPPPVSGISSYQSTR